MKVQTQVIIEGQALITEKVTQKSYRCTQCGHVSLQKTNHYLDTWSFGVTNVCPVCPPYKKYPQYGGRTVWECLDKPEVRDEK